MISVVNNIKEFTGLVKGKDETALALGELSNCRNMANYFQQGRLQKIRGFDTTTAYDLSGTGTPLNGFLYLFPVKLNDVNYVFGVWMNDGSTEDNYGVFNFTSSSATYFVPFIEPTTGPYAGKYLVSHTYYAGFTYITLGIRGSAQTETTILRIDDPVATNWDIVSGTPDVPTGHFIKAYRGRLYIGGIERIPGGTSATETDRSKVYYCNVLDGPTVFDTYASTKYIYFDEIPGHITALAINSPTSAAGTVVGELIIAKEFGLAKLTGDPNGAETTLDIVSASVGSRGNNTFVNTPAGLVFEGYSRGRYSVYYLPIGTAGEPIDIGSTALESILNDPINPIDETAGSPHYPYEHWAVYHEGFYKLFLPIYDYNASAYRTGELWLDVEYFLRTQQIRWYGIHRRFTSDYPVCAMVFDGDNKLHVVERRNNNSGNPRKSIEATTFGSNKHFDFPVTSAIEAHIEIPLNVEPLHEDKSFDLLMLSAASESNYSTNVVTQQNYVDGVSQGNAVSRNIFDADLVGTSHVVLPLVDSNEISMTGKHGKVLLKHTVNNRLDLLGAEVQYLTKEKQRVESD